MPDREPEDLEDVKRMMTGRRATFQSRMTFHYDFLLKTLQSGNLKWHDLMCRSYWYRRHEANVRACQADLAAARANLTAVALSDQEIADMEVGEELQARVKTTVNAARREAQRALEAWKRPRLGARVHAVEKDLWPRYRALQREIAALEAEAAALAEPQRDVEPALETLRRLQFLDDGEALTPLGTMATEVNEGHPVLMTLLYKDWASVGTMDPKEILAILAVFLGEDKGESYRPAVPPAVERGLAAVATAAARCSRAELETKTVAPASYWDVSTTWVEPVWRFVNGEGLATLATDYGIYEGNLIRALSKMANVLEEWRTLATLATDTTMLEALREAAALLTPAIATADSLYLRI
jgi:superfamily II RNA helicase